MTEMENVCDGNVLLVGDGDFSFSVALLRRLDWRGHQAFATSLESQESVQVHAQAVENSGKLQELDVKVLMEVDARDLHNHTDLNTLCYARIIFNFPLADRHNIKKNRSLLDEFLASCKHILTKTGQVMITLCKGQGGTPADQPMRSWQDSWQVVAMAAKSGYVLTDVVPFCATEFPEYHSVGFRFQDKSFNTSGALTHIFEQAEVAEDSESNTRGLFTHGKNSYSCSSYVAQKMKRNLLNEVNNPVAILKGAMVKALGSTAKVTETDPLCKGHKFKVVLTRSNRSSSGDGNKDEKDRKNLALAKRKKMDAKLLVHAVDRQCGNEDGKENTDKIHFEKVMQQYIPKNCEDVYPLIKVPNDKRSRTGSEELNYMEVATDAFQNGESLCGPTADVEDMINEDTDSSSRVFHCNCSILEHVPELVTSFLAGKKHLINNQPVSVSGACGNLECRHVESQDCRKENNTAHNDGSQSAECPMQTTPSPSSFDKNSAQEKSLSDCSDGHHVTQATNQIPRFCVATSQCMKPALIEPGTLNVAHELVYMNLLEVGGAKDSGLEQNATAHSLQLDSTPNLVKQADWCSQHVLNLMQNSPYFQKFCHFSLGPVVDGFKVEMEQVDEIMLLNQILVTMTRQCDKEDQGRLGTRQEAAVVGVTLCIQKGENFFYLCLFNLDELACNLYSLPDSRILWSTSEKFLQQFCSSQLRPNLFKPISLYPLKYSHDLSFWERDNEDIDFDSLAFCDVIRNIAGDLVVNVAHVDSYTNPDTGRRSRCYRLHFQSQDRALSYLSSWKMQSKIRLRVAQTLGVELR